MSVSSVIDTASAGLRATQAGLDVVSQNVANSSTVGYTRRTLTTTQTVSGNQTTGVNVVGVQRTLDTMVQKQLRLETAGASYTSAMASAGTQLDAAFDQTSGSSSLSSLVTTFTSSLQTLAADPSTYQNKTAVLSAANDLANSLNSLSDTVQDMRQSAENSLSTDVKSANSLLKQIASVNKTIISSTDNQSSAALLDQRDSLIDQLSSLMDVSVTSNSNGSVSIATTSGFQLFDGQSAVTLSFNAKSPVMAQSAYSTDPSQSGVGTITATDGSGHTTDLIAAGAIKSGDMAAQIELRDTVLPQAQTQLDSLAAGLATSLSDTTTAGTATGTTPPGYGLDISDLANGKAATVSYVDSTGTTQTLSLVRVDDASSVSKVSSTVGGNAVGIDFSGGASAIQSQIQAALAKVGLTGSVSTTSPMTLTVTSASSISSSVAGLSKSATVSGTQSGSAQLALFVDGGKAASDDAYTGSLSGTPQLTGFAGRITVNSAVTNDPDLLVDYSASTQSGDSTRPSFLLSQLTSASQSFTSAAGIGSSTNGFTGSFSDFAQQVISFQAAASNSASSLNDGQQTVLSGVQDRYSDKAGVNIDTEMTQLIQLQTAYSANARVLTAANDLLQTLLSTVQ